MTASPTSRSTRPTSSRASAPTPATSASRRHSASRFWFSGAGDEGAMRISAVGVVYLVVGAIVAASHDYFDSIDTLKQFLSAVLAVVLWPLILIGIDLHVH